MLPDTLDLIRWQLRARSPFFASLSLFAEAVWVTDGSIPTAATDGQRLFFNASFMATLTPAERLGVYAHELLHAALCHPSRRGGRDPWLWNVAADVVVNGMVREQEGFALPKGALIEKELEKFSAEEVYALLEKASHQGWLKMARKSKFWQDLLEPSETGASLETTWRDAWRQSEHIAGLGVGHLSLNLRRNLERQSQSELDWRTLLWRFIVRTPVDYSGWDRRFVHEELYLETLEGEQVEAYVCVDTSASIGMAQLDQFAGELLGMLRQYPHLRVHLFCADSELKGPWALTSATQAKDLPEFIGGDGTDFRPFFYWIKQDQKKKSQDAVAVYLTDGHGEFPGSAPEVPVLWVVAPGGLEHFPFGTAVRLGQK